MGSIIPLAPAKLPKELTIAIYCIFLNVLVKQPNTLLFVIFIVVL